MVLHPAASAFRKIRFISGTGLKRIIFADGGFKPVLNGKELTPGPEQLAVVGFDEYANASYDLGIDDSIH